MNPKFRVMHVVKRKHIQEDKIQLTVKKKRGKRIELGKQKNPEIAHRSQFFSIFFFVRFFVTAQFQLQQLYFAYTIVKKTGLE